jgi:hypothetical protein
VVAIKALVLDIETSPALADVWKLWDNNVGLSQLREVTNILCFAAKWHGSKKVEFHSDFHNGHAEMIGAAHELWSAADVLVHYNGDSFDLKHLRREFLLAGLNPPAPAQSVDLLRVVKKEFRFISNKLDHVSRQLGLVGKVAHSGHELWQQVMKDDPKAWATMRRYCMGDVRLTDDLYSRLKPWVGNHPHVGLIDGLGPETCNRCGSDKLQRRGWRHTLTGSYRAYQCQGCGGWSQSTSRDSGVKVRGT